MIFPEDITNLLGAFLLFLAMALICFEEAALQRISVVFILFPLIVGINFLTENAGLYTFLSLGGVFREVLGDKIFNNSNYYILDSAVHIFYSLVKVGFWFFVYKLFSSRLSNVKSLLTQPMWWIINIICLAPLTGVISLITFTPKSTYLIYPAVISTIITIFGVLVLLGYISDTVKTQMENKSLRLQKAYYNELEERQRETAKLRHDMNNHLSVISTFIINEEKEKARSYYESLSGEIQTKNRVFCRNSIVNAVINSKYNKAIERQIDCFFNIDLGNIISIDDISLCSIFANTLDNAIEACELISDISRRSISLKARQVEKYLSYEITNSKNNEIIEKKGIFKTSKLDKKNHGYGLLGVKDIVQNYNGNINISYTANIFTVTILLEV